MATNHISEAPMLAGLKGGLLFGIDQSYLVDADLASGLTAAKAAVNADNNAGHVTQRTYGPRITASLDQIGNYDSTYLTGSDADKSTMTALSNASRGRSLNF